MPASRPAVGALIAASGLPALDARALMSYVLGVSRERLVAHPEQSVSAETAQRFDALAARRRGGEPLAYLLGVREFHGRDFHVGPGVLVPRPETELLVELALAAVREQQAPRVLDLGTGSGCIAITLALARPDARIVACDRAPAALAVASRNAQALGARVNLVEGDWYDGVDGRFDLVVSNPPYIAAGDPHLAALSHEPLDALTDHGDGLSCLRRIAQDAPAHLHPTGWLMVEHGYDQGAAVRRLFEGAGLHDVRTHRDAAGHDRACAGHWPGESTA